MLATYVTDLITPIVAGNLAIDLRSSIIAATGKDATADTLCVLLAQSALETGNWKSIHRLNLGNMKAGDAYKGLFTCFRCNEIIGGKVQWFSPDTAGFAVPPGHPQTRFRAYEDLAHAALEYVTFLSNRVHYVRAWRAALAGSAAEFVHELKAAGYFTASEAPYLRAVVSLAKTYRDAAVAAATGAPVAPAPAKIGSIDESTERSLTSDRDLVDHLRTIEWPDWRDAVDLQRMADELENDLRDAGAYS